MEGRTILAAVLVLVSCSGCVGSASTVLKSPVSSRCERTGLRGCAAISEGVLLYAEGKKDEAIPQLQAGAAANSPEKVRQFADLLDALSEMPGTGKYAAPIHEVVALLTIASSQLNPIPLQDTPPSPKAAQQIPVNFPGPYSHGKLRGVVTADTDVAQIRGGLVESPTASPEWCVRSFGAGARCVVLLGGPLFLTDASPRGPECEGQFLAVMAGDQIQARFEAPVRMHGARILIAEGSNLIFGQRPALPASNLDSVEAPGTGDPPDEKASPARSCSIFWSGFIPYELNPYRDPQAPEEFEL